MKQSKDCFFLKKWSNPCLFLFIFILFKDKFYIKKQKSSMGFELGRWARWPLDHHHSHVRRLLWGNFWSNFFDLILGSFYGWNVQDSPIHKVYFFTRYWTNRLKRLTTFKTSYEVDSEEVQTKKSILNLNWSLQIKLK